MTAGRTSPNIPHMLNEDIWCRVVEAAGCNEWLDRTTRDVHHKSPFCEGLYALALTNRSISQIAQSAIYRRIYLSNHIRALTFLTTVKPWLARCVQSVEIDLNMEYGCKDYQNVWPWVFWLSTTDGLELLSRFENVKTLIITGWHYLEIDVQVALPPAYHDEFSRTRAAVCDLPQLHKLCFVNNIVFDPVVWLVPISSSSINSLGIFGTSFIDDSSGAQTQILANVPDYGRWQSLTAIAMSYENIVGDLGEQWIRFGVLNLNTLLKLSIDLRVDLVEHDVRRQRYETPDPLVQFLIHHGSRCTFSTLKRLCIEYINPETELYPHQVTRTTVAIAPHLIGPKLDDLLTSMQAFRSVFLTLSIMTNPSFSPKQSINRVQYLLPRLDDEGRVAILEVNQHAPFNIN